MAGELSQELAEVSLAQDQGGGATVPIPEQNPSPHHETEFPSRTCSARRRSSHPSQASGTPRVSRTRAALSPQLKVTGPRPWLLLPAFKRPWSAPILHFPDRWSVQAGVRRP